MSFDAATRHDGDEEDDDDVATLRRMRPAKSFWQKIQQKGSERIVNSGIDAQVEAELLVKGFQPSEPCT